MTEINLKVPIYMKFVSLPSTRTLQSAFVSGCFDCKHPKEVIFKYFIIYSLSFIIRTYVYKKCFNNFPARNLVKKFEF